MANHCCMYVEYLRSVKHESVHMDGDATVNLITHSSLVRRHQSGLHYGMNGCKQCSAHFSLCCQSGVLYPPLPLSSLPYPPLPISTLLYPPLPLLLSSTLLCSSLSSSTILYPLSTILYPPLPLSTLIYPPLPFLTSSTPSLASSTLLYHPLPSSTLLYPFKSPLPLSTLLYPF